MSSPVEQLVKSCLNRREFYLGLATEQGSPLYMIEEAPLMTRADCFLKAFRKELPETSAFFPVKTNSHHRLLETMVKAGLGIEVSSGLELECGLQAGAGEILFNGPAKTVDELELALHHRDRVTVIMDSWNELERLLNLTSKHKTRISTGVRLAVESGDTSWGKFGIALNELHCFAEKAAQSPYLQLEGLQFHTSWNMTPEPQVDMLQRIGSTLATVPKELRQRLVFLDIGGGFWPEWGEWLSAEAPEGKLYVEEPPFYTIEPAVPIEGFVNEIAATFRKHIDPCIKCRLFAEPGRWICSNCGSMLLTLLDLKGNGIAITDGATSMLGGEMVEYCYLPLINLTRPAMTERSCLITGSLCTPRDRWGFSYFGSDLQCGDILLIPNIGAYSYSLRQQFIKPLPRTLFISADYGKQNRKVEVSV